ncbi:hypothetical protein ACF0H5_017855 [Mactra antiquata]
MADQFIEKKVYYLGVWGKDTVDAQTINEINSQIASQKGNRIKLQLGSDGIRMLKTTVIQGKVLHDYIPIEKIQLMTVSQNLPDLLMVTSLSKGDKNKFQINVFRCANGLDAGMFMQTYRALQKRIKTVQVVPSRVIKQQDDDINWTLRSKEHDNTKRELKQLVDIHGEKAVLHKVTDGTVYIQENGTSDVHVQNGHTEVFENGVRIPLYRKGKPTRIEKESVESDMSDNKSEVSESALRNELENLSQELRDIKIMLEHSTGISQPGSPVNFRPVNVDVHKHTVQPQTVVLHAANTDAEDRIETEVVEDDDDAVVLRRHENGVSHSTSGSVTHVRVNVPDYRSFNENTTSYTVTTTKVPVQERRHYEVVTPTRTTSTTSYEDWKKNTMERNAVRYSELPERIQWRSRPARASHVIATRTRSAIPVWSSDVTDSSNSVEVRHHSAGFGPAYQRVSFNPRVAKIDKKAHSLRARNLSTTVAKPIERVYTGRPDAKHHSLSYRATTLRPSVLVTKESVPNNTQQAIVVEQNNNVVKQDVDEQLLDVSGIDLYKETPIEGAVIRT